MTTPATIHTLARAALVLALTLPAAASAQEPEQLRLRLDRDAECRCVDSAGEEIEDCRCLRTFVPDFGAWTYSLDAAPRARIGVSVDVGQEGADADRGVVLRDVVEGSPAWDAGLREGDVVTRVAGRSVFQPLEDAEDEDDLDAGASLAVQRFLALARELEPGEEVEIEYLRDGESRRASVTPEEGGLARVFWGDGGARVSTFPRGEAHYWSRVLPYSDSLVVRHRFGADELEPDFRGVRMFTRDSDPCVRAAAGGSGSWIVTLGGDRCVDGLRVQELNPQLAAYFGVEEGVLVTEVLEEAALGVRAGDVVVAIDGREVDAPSDVRRILGSYETDEPVTLTVVRRGERMEVRGTRRAPTDPS